MKIYHIAAKDIKALFVDRKALAALLITPLILTLILGLALGSLWDSEMPPSRVLYLNADEGELGDILFTEVLTSPELAKHLKTEVAPGRSEARSLVQQGDATAFIYVPDDFSDDVFRGAKTSIELATDPGSAVRGQIIQSVVESFAAEISARQVIYETLLSVESMELMLEALDEVWDISQPPLPVLYDGRSAGGEGHVALQALMNTPAFSERIVLKQSTNREEAAGMVERGEALAYIEFADNEREGDILISGHYPVEGAIIERIIEGIQHNLSTETPNGFRGWEEMSFNGLSDAGPGGTGPEGGSDMVPATKPAPAEELAQAAEPATAAESAPDAGLTPEPAAVAEPGIEAATAASTATATESPTDIQIMPGMFLPPEVVEEALENTVINLKIRDGFIRDEDDTITPPSAMDYYAAGMGVMYLLFTVNTGAQRFVEERHNLTLARMVQSPTPAWQITAGKFLGIFLMGLVQFTVIIFASSLLFGVVWGDPAGVLFLTLASVTAAAGIALLVAALAKTAEAADSLGTFIALFMAALGGSWFPLYAMPEWMQNFTKITLNSWAIEGFTKLMFTGAAPADISLNIGVLFVAGIVLSIAAGIMIRKR